MATARKYKPHNGSGWAPLHIPLGYSGLRNSWLYLRRAWAKHKGYRRASRKPITTLKYWR